LVLLIVNGIVLPMVGEWFGGFFKSNKLLRTIDNNNKPNDVLLNFSPSNDANNKPSKLLRTIDDNSKPNDVIMTPTTCRRVSAAPTQQHVLLSISNSNNNNPHDELWKNISNINDNNSKPNDGPWNIGHNDKPNEGLWNIINNNNINDSKLLSMSNNDDNGKLNYLHFRISNNDKPERRAMIEYQDRHRRRRQQQQAGQQRNAEAVRQAVEYMQRQVQEEAEQRDAAFSWPA
jgi:hypothetical protein